MRRLFNLECFVVMGTELSGLNLKPTALSSLA